MATISENLQIIADSTAAIKQAIIDKGGTINGDITTWASAVNGISGGDNTEKITFAGAVTGEPMGISISGSFNKTFDMVKRIFIFSYADTMVTWWGTLNVETSGFSASVDFNAPLMGVPPFSMVMTDYDGTNAKVVDLILL